MATLPEAKSAPQPADAMSLKIDDWGRLVLTDPTGTESVGVTPVRGFPLSAPREEIFLVDGNGREVKRIDNLDRLPEATRQILETRLADREFVPRLLSVRSISAAVEPSEWEVETDRGVTRFLLKNEDDAHLLPNRQAVITDSYGIRYLIPDVRALDARSRRLLERFF